MYEDDARRLHMKDGKKKRENFHGMVMEKTVGWGLSSDLPNGLTAIAA